jgi:hypothetical protein
MKTCRFGRIRRFRFNLPQRIAAGLLALFLAQGLWLAVDEAPPEHRPLLLFLRLLLLAAGCMLGGALWWVTRRLYGNLGGYTALALYCFSSPVLKACVSLNHEVLTALGVYGGIYASIGVVHAMQGPRRKWRPRIVLLTAIFAVTAASHIAALAVAAVLGLAFMLWVAEERRSLVLPVVLIALASALVAVFICRGFSSDAFSFLLRSGAEGISLSLEPARSFFGTMANAGVTIAAGAAAVLFLGTRKSWYFGNTVPLVCAVALSVIVMTGVAGSQWLWALPFLLTFVGGVFADAYEGAGGRLAMAAAGIITLLQAVLCWLSLPGLL